MLQLKKIILYDVINEWPLRAATAAVLQTFLRLNRYSYQLQILVRV